jgi:nitrogen regulatory protein PII
LEPIDLATCCRCDYAFCQSTAVVVFWELIVVKLVLAVIQPPKLEPLREALDRLGVTRMTVCDSQGYARQRGRSAMYRGHEYKTHLLRKITLEIVVNDDFLERTIDAIVEVARTGTEGTIGDGKIFVLPMDDVIDISNSGRGPQAVN